MGDRYTTALDRWIPWARHAGEARNGSLIELSLSDGEPCAAPPGPPAAHVGPVSLWRSGPTVVVLGPGGLSGYADLDRGRGGASARAGDVVGAWKVVRGYLRLLWHLMLARRGLHALHASGVVIDDGAILIVGRSGAGKSTLAARFALAGAHLLSDDTIFAVERSGQVAGLGDSSRLADGLALAREPTGQDPDGKLTVPARSVTTGPAEPRLLLFLDEHLDSEIRCEPLRPGDAMAELLRSGFANLDPTSAAPHLKALGCLAESCRAFRVSRGPEPPPPAMLERWMEMASA